MTVYNVSIPMVGLVEADSEREAIDLLWKRIESHGVDYSIDCATAFVSEELPVGTDIIRYETRPVELP